MQFVKTFLEVKYLVLEAERELLKNCDFWLTDEKLSYQTNAYVSGVLEMTDAILEKLEKINE